LAALYVASSSIFPWTGGWLVFGIKVAAAWFQRGKDEEGWLTTSLSLEEGDFSRSQSLSFGHPGVQAYRHTIIQSYRKMTGQPLSETLMMPAEGRIESWEYLSTTYIQSLVINGYQCTYVIN
jgi:hypothetical protein